MGLIGSLMISPPHFGQVYRKQPVQPKQLQQRRSASSFVQVKLHWVHFISNIFILWMRILRMNTNSTNGLRINTNEC